jgi:ribonuclease BN (tRNA processing enzyme)
MRLRVLGCSGGIGGRQLRTTSFLVDEDVLVDAGTGVAELSLSEMALIDHIFVTHSHLDHVNSIPFLVDTVGGMRNKPVTVHAMPETLAILHAHIFNWSIWPDFSEVPSKEAPFLRFQPMQLGETVDLGGRRFTSLPANHIVPAVGYRLDSGEGSLVFSGDTTTNNAFWAVVNDIPNLKYLIMETAFCNRERPLAILSKHLCPSLLADELGKLELSPEIYISHLKPGEIELTMQEIDQCAAAYRPHMLQNNQVFDF